MHLGSNINQEIGGEDESLATRVKTKLENKMNLNVADYTSAHYFPILRMEGFSHIWFIIVKEDLFLIT